MRTIHYLLTFIILLSVFSCQDEDILPVQNNEMPPFTNSTTRAIGITSGLTQDANGYWVASRRIPLIIFQMLWSVYSVGKRMLPIWWILTLLTPLRLQE